MPTLRMTRPLARESGEKLFRVTISGPAKGPKPIVFEVAAPDAKAAGLCVRKLIATGRMTVAQA